MREYDLKVGATRYGVMLYCPEDGCAGHGFHRYGEYSEAEVELFRYYVRPDWVALDIGANIGAHTVALSRLAKQVFAWEADGSLARLIGCQLVLNDIYNVVVHGEPAGRETAFPECQFIKLDVDGPEREILAALQPVIDRCKPVLYVENDRIQDATARIELIRSFDYTPYWHLAPLYRDDNFLGAPVAPEDKPNASMMMLCVPKGTQVPPGFIQAFSEDVSSVFTPINPDSSPQGYVRCTFCLVEAAKRLGVLL